MKVLRAAISFLLVAFVGLWVHTGAFCTLSKWGSWFLLPMSCIECHGTCPAYNFCAICTKSASLLSMLITIWCIGTQDNSLPSSIGKRVSTMNTQKVTRQTTPFTSSGANSSFTSHAHPTHARASHFRH
jgi:hypothetical protein